MEVFTFDDSHICDYERDENFFVDYADWALFDSEGFSKYFQPGNRLAAHCKGRHVADPAYWQPIFQRIREAGYVPCVSMRGPDDYPEKVAAFKAMGVEVLNFANCANKDNA